MKKSDLGIVMIHWMIVVVLLGAAASGICLWKQELQPHVAVVFEPANVGVIHIGLSVAVLVIFALHLAYLNHKNFWRNITLRRLTVNSRVRWGRVNILFYWVLLTVIFMETVTGILLTKLVNQDVLARVFRIEKGSLLFLHLYLVIPILAFPIVHVMVHWLDGRSRKIFSIFQPQVCPRAPSQAAILLKLRAENVRLKEKVKNENSGPGGVDFRRSD